MPRYKFKWSNLPPSLLDALCGEPCQTSTATSTTPLPRCKRPMALARTRVHPEAWPTLLRSWLPTATEARERIVRALQEVHHDKALP